MAPTHRGRSGRQNAGRCRFAGERGDLFAMPVGVLACDGFAFGDRVESGGEVHQCRQDTVLVPVSRWTIFAIDAPQRS